MQDDFLRSLFRCELGGIDHHFRISRLLVGIRNAGEFLDNSSPRLRVETLAIALFAYLNRGREMHHNKSANWLDHGAHMLASGVIRRDRSTNCNTAIFGDLGSDISDAVNVEVSMFLGKAKFGRKMLANQITIQKCYWSAAHFEKFGDENAGNRRFTGAREASEKDCQALFVPWWKTAPQFLYDLRIGKPCRNVAALI